MVISGNKKLTELVQLSSESIPDQSEHPTNMLLKFVCFSHGWNFANKVKFDSLCLPANICPLLTPTKKKSFTKLLMRKHIEDLITFCQKPWLSREGWSPCKSWYISLCSHWMLLSLQSCVSLSCFSEGTTQSSLPVTTAIPAALRSTLYLAYFSLASTLYGIISQKTWILFLFFWRKDFVWGSIVTESM